MLQEILDELKLRIIPPKLVERSVRISLPAAAQYTAGDVLASTAANTAGLGWRFTNLVRVNGGSGYIVQARARSETESITPQLALQVYTKEPTGERDDNNAGASPTNIDFFNYKGEIILPAMIDRGDESYAMSTPGTAGGTPFPFVCNPHSRDLYLIVLTVDTFTQTTDDYLIVSLVVDQY